MTRLVGCLARGRHVHCTEYRVVVRLSVHSAHVLHIVPACNQNSWVDLGDPVLKEGDRDWGSGPAFIHHIIIII